MKKTIQINPDLLKIPNKRKQGTETTKKRTSLNTMKRKLLTQASKPQTESLKDAVGFLSNITDKKKWVDVSLDMPDVFQQQKQEQESNAPPLIQQQQQQQQQQPLQQQQQETQPPYGCLKQGTKPTYRSWLRSTQKNYASMIDMDAMTAPDVALNEKMEKELAVIDELKTEKPSSTDLVQTVKTKTIRKHIIGKNLKNRTITVLLKDSEKKKQVLEAKKDLKNEKVDKMRDFLIKRNLLKASSYAPTSVISKIFENARLTGDVFNTNMNTLMNNILLPA